MSESGGLSCDTFKDVVDKAVHDGHGLAGNTGVWVHLFQDFVDVDGVGFPPPPLLLLVTSSLSFSLGGGFLSSFRSNFGWHVSLLNKQTRMTATLNFSLYTTQRGIEMPVRFS